MTDTEQKEICRIAHIDDISDLSDGYHTFRQLYYQRMMLFAALVKQNKDKAWKSLRHSDGELCFGGGWFIVGIDTPEGSYTYHYEDNFFSLFDCEELEKGKVWDGHTEKDVTRLLSLKQESCDDAISRQAVLDLINADWKYEGLEIPVGNLPSVTPQQKVGRWVGHKEHCESIGMIPSGFGAYKWCSNCDCGIDVKEWSRNSYNFCPNCGIKMEG